VRSRLWTAARGTLLGTIGLLAIAPVASADHHLVRISEIHHESDSVSSGDWVELQFLADGQNVLATHYLHMYDVTGAGTGSVPLPTVANGGNQRTVLIGSGLVPGADLNDGGARVYFAGSACYDEGTGVIGGIDCVVWGPSTVFGGGSPATPPAPVLGDGDTLQRTLARGCPTALDAADDTDSSAADFAIGSPSPRSNAMAPSGTPCIAAPAAAKKKAKKKCKKGFKLKKIKKKGKKPKRKCVKKKKRKKKK
jgi:hypothetical protein